MLIFEHDYEDGNWIKIITKVYQPLKEKGEIPILQVKATNRPSMDILLYDMHKDKDFLEDLYLALQKYFPGKTDAEEPIVIGGLSPKECAKCYHAFVPKSPAQKWCENCRKLNAPPQDIDKETNE